MYHRHDLKRHIVAPMLGNYPTEEDARANSQIPGDKESAVGSAALIMSRHIDNHVLESRPYMPVPQAYQHSGDVVTRH